MNERDHLVELLMVIFGIPKAKTSFNRLLFFLCIKLDVSALAFLILRYADFFYNREPFIAAIRVESQIAIRV